jgi:hypothetical protein
MFPRSAFANLVLFYFWLGEELSSTVKKHIAFSG